VSGARSIPLGAEDVERLIGVSGHVELAPDDPEHAAITIDHEGGSLARQGAESLHAEETGDRAIGIREQWKAERVLLVESLLPIHRIGADPCATTVQRFELAGQVAKVTALDRSARGHGLRIEEENQGPLRHELTQSDRPAILIERTEIVDEVVLLHIDLRGSPRV
jgi:hypothetical protein